MTDYVDIELGLQRWDTASLSLEMRVSDPSDEADRRVVWPGSSAQPLWIDLAALGAHQDDPLTYGTLLGAAIFANPDVQSLFDQAFANAQRAQIPVRLRLNIGPTAPELHAIRWETLCDRQGRPLLLGEHIYFSRLLMSNDPYPVRAKPRGRMRALIAVANPSGLQKFNLAPVDVPAEVARAQDGLVDIDQDLLVAAGQVTLDNLIGSMRQAAEGSRPIDILYLVCHGSFVAGRTFLWLEQSDGSFERVDGNELSQRISELRERPRLIMLIACQSAGGSARSSTDRGALAALGPRLAEIGVPAVVAMQGNVTMSLIARFIPLFFAELQADGQIDRAMALTRGHVRDHHDHWMPVLFTRFKSGRIWYVPGFSDDEGFDKWPAFLTYLREGRCTPVIGTHVSETLLGSSSQIAQAWADAYDYPLEPHERGDLPQVAQYLSVYQDYRFPRAELVRYLREQLIARYGMYLSNPDTSTINDLFAAVGQRERARNPNDPYKVFAELPLPIYVTTNASNLLVEALRAAGKEPIVEICRWNEELEVLPSIFDSDLSYTPSAARPLVYHLFGVFERPETLVLTEDDYFDFLIGVSERRDLVPKVVRDALVDKALVLFGFRLDDWSFRVVFRTLMSQQGRSRRTRYTHVAGQLMPQEGEVLKPERAIGYLKNYFADPDRGITIYWGSPGDFSRDLSERLAEYQVAIQAPKRKRRF